MIEDEDLNHAHEVLHYSDKEDKYVGMVLIIRYANDFTAEYYTVKLRSVWEDVHPVGTAHNNIIIYTRQYEVQYVGGKIEYLTSNAISENLLPRVDE